MGKKVVNAEYDGFEWAVIPSAIRAFAVQGDGIVKIMLDNGVIMDCRTDNADEFIRKAIRYGEDYSEFDSESAIDFQYGDLFE